MLSTVIWLGSIALEILIPVRGYMSGLVKTYPFFYIYISCVAIADLARWWCYHFQFSFYRSFYWYSDSLTILASSLVLFEIVRELLSDHPGVGRMVRQLLLIVLAVTVVGVVAYSLRRPLKSFVELAANVAGDIRYVQATLLFVLLVMLSRYYVTFSRNMQGVTIGYSMLVGIDVMTLVLIARLCTRLHPCASPARLNVLLWLHSAIYPLILVIWLITLWTPVSAPVRSPDPAIQRDYEKLAALVRRTIASATRRLLKGPSHDD